MSGHRANSLNLWWTTVPPAQQWRAEPCLALLDSGERERARRAVKARHRQRFLVAHAGLRMVLAHHLDVAPKEIALRRGACPLCGLAHGKPQVIGHESLHFSMSHSDDGVLFAVYDGAVGVDLERYPPREDSAQRLGRYLHANEQRLLAAAPRHERDAAFLRFWLRKEAYLKAIGVGLAHGITPGNVDIESVPGWRTLSLTVPAGFQASAVVAADSAELLSIRHTLLAAPGSDSHVG